MASTASARSGWIAARARMPLGCTPNEAPRGRRDERSNTATRRSGLQRCKWVDKVSETACCPAVTGAEKPVAVAPRQWARPLAAAQGSTPGGQYGLGSSQPPRPAANHRHVQLLLSLWKDGDTAAPRWA